MAIDGRARPSCLAHAWRKVKPGGHLLLDDSEREHYAAAARPLAGWPRRDLFGPGPYLRIFFRTTIWGPRPPDAAAPARPDGAA